MNPLLSSQIPMSLEKPIDPVHDLHALAHDLRTPLFAMSGYLQLLEKQLSSTAFEKAKEYLSEARVAARHLDERLRSMMASSLHREPVSRQIEWVAIAPIFDRLWQLYRLRAKQEDVQDNGCGIPEYAQPRIFEPFVQLHSENPGQGVGLGLAIVRSVMTAHDGDVTVQSIPGAGSRFTLRFPFPAAA
jgi:signal transduction histidine kinase